MNADGTNKTVVYNKGTSYAPDWSPDGKRLVFVNQSGSLWGGTTQVYLYLINVDGSGLCKLAKLNTTAVFSDSIRPVWSPRAFDDGYQWIVYSDRAASGHDLFAVRADCANPGTPVNLTNSAEAETWPSWSRFATYLAATVPGPADSDEFCPSQVALYDVSFLNGAPRLSNRKTLSELGLSVPNPGIAAWAKNSDRIVMTASDDPTNVDLWVTDLTPAGTFAIAATADMDETRASWSPDGTEIVFYDMAYPSIWKLARQLDANGRETWVRTQQLYSGLAYRGLSWRR